MSTLTPHIATPTDAKRKAAEDSKRARTIRRLEESIRGLETRNKKLVRTVNTFLSSKAISEAQRADLVGLLAGTHPRAGEAPGAVIADDRIYRVSSAELKLLEYYRGMTAYRRRLLTGLVLELGTKKRLKE